MLQENETMNLNTEEGEVPQAIIGPMPPEDFGEEGSFLDSPPKEETTEQDDLNIPQEPQVKVFIINEDGDWSDCGVGKLLFLNADTIIVVADNVNNEDIVRDVITPDRAKSLRDSHSESTVDLIGKDRGELILKMDLKKGKNFIQTQATIITWEQEDIEENVALSFIYSYDCLVVWKHICTMHNISQEEEFKKEDLESIIDYLSGKTFLAERHNLIFRFTTEDSPFDKIRNMYDTARSEDDHPTLIKIAALMDALIACGNTDLSLKMFSERLYKFVFGALEYSLNNFDPETTEKKADYLEFLEKESHMLVIDPAAMTENFEKLVKLRFRTQFYMDYVQNTTKMNPEIVMAHLKTLMSTLNIHLLDFFTDKDFIVRTLYPTDQIAKLKVCDFASEFFSIFKSLANEVKMELSDSFRKNGVGSLCLARIHEILLEFSRSQGGERKTMNEVEGEVTSSSFLKIELSSAKEMEKEWWQKTKNLVVAHLEVLYVVCRRDKEYSYNLFREFKEIQETLILLMEFPDDSAFDILMELLIPQGDPFTFPQDLLISFLGMITVKGLVLRLETRIWERIENNNVEEQDKAKEKMEREAVYFFRLVLFLNCCMYSLSPNTIKIFEEMEIGVKLTEFLNEIDPKMILKSVHFGLTKFFIKMSTSSHNEIVELYPTCKFSLIIYDKYRRRSNLINSQYHSIYSNLSEFWSKDLKKYVELNEEKLIYLRDEKADSLIKRLLEPIIDLSGKYKPPSEKPTNMLNESMKSISSHLLGNSEDFGEEDKNSLQYPSDLEMQFFELGNNENQIQKPDNEDFNHDDLSHYLDFNMPFLNSGRSPSPKKEFLLMEKEKEKYEEDEESEAKNALKFLIDSLRKKNEEVEEDVSVLMNDENESTLVPCTSGSNKLAFQFLNETLEDEDDGTLPPLPAQKSLIAMNLGKRDSPPPLDDTSNNNNKHLKI